MNRCTGNLNARRRGPRPRTPAASKAAATAGDALTTPPGRMRPWQAAIPVTCIGAVVDGIATPSASATRTVGGVRSVRHNGQIKWQGRLRSIGEAFVGYPVALRAQPGGVYEVYFQRLLLGTLHDRDASGLRPAKSYRSRSKT